VGCTSDDFLSISKIYVEISTAVELSTTVEISTPRMSENVFSANLLMQVLPPEISTVKFFFQKWKIQIMKNILNNYKLSVRRILTVLGTSEVAVL